MAKINNEINIEIAFDFNSFIIYHDYTICNKSLEKKGKWKIG